MAASIPAILYNFLKTTVNGEIEDFTIDLSNNVAGVGYSGDVLFVTMTSKKSHEKQSMVIKKPFGLDEKQMEAAFPLYNNEIIFYDEIWPKFKALYTAKTGKNLNFIGNCLGTTKDGMPGLAFENLAIAGFKTSDRSLNLGDNHLEMAFKVYGIFHGISMAFKEKNIDEYFAFINKIKFSSKDIYGPLSPMNTFLKHVVKNAQSFFNPDKENDIIEKLKKYEGIAPEYLLKLVSEESPQRVIKHGDCWSCNMMFKYKDNGQLEDMRLIDFQLINSGSPVHDLSYFFYSGAQSFSNFQKYIKIYHSALTDTLAEFDLDVEEVYSFETLNQEWIKHCKFGLFLALIVWKMKLSDQPMPSLANENKFMSWMMLDEVDDYRSKIRDLIIHMHKNDFL